MEAIKCTQCGAPLYADRCAYCGSWYPNLRATLAAEERRLHPIIIWKIGPAPFKDLFEMSRFEAEDVINNLTRPPADLVKG